jgi:hypothetical protein
MAIINKTGITTGGTIDAEHITRVIDALSGVSADSVVATGSLLGTASYAQNAGSSVTAVTASYSLNFPTSAATASYATAADTIKLTDTQLGNGPYYPIFATQAGLGQIARVDTQTFTYNATQNRLTVTSSFAISSSVAVTASVAERIRANQPIGATPDGTFYVSETSPGMHADLFIIIGGTAYRFESTEAL